MTRGFLSSIAGIVLVAVLLVFTAVNIWQSNRIERSLLDMTKRVAQIEKDLESGAFAGSGTANGSGPTGGIFGKAEPAYITQALQSPDNLLKRDPANYLPADAQQGGTLRLHLGSTPKGFNFLNENSTDVSEIRRFVSCYLIERHKKDPTAWGPQLAYKVTQSEDLKTWTFYIRDDVLWHEPLVDFDSGRYDWLKGEHKVTAHDIKFMFDMLMNSQVVGAAPARSYLEELESWRAIDDTTFEMVFSEAVYHQRSIIIPGLDPIPEFIYAYDESGERFDDEIIGQKFADHWYRLGIGCGPYKMTRFEPEVLVELERNPKFPLGSNAFDKVQYLILSDQNIPPRMLRTEELDLAYLQPGQYRTEVLEGPADSPFKDGSLVAGEWWPYNYFYIGWNMRKDRFKDKRVRQAMSYALNVELLLKDVFMGLGERTSGPMPAFVPWYDKSLTPYPFDLDKAVALLEEAGWVDTNDDGIRDKQIDGRRVEFEFKLLIYGSSDEFRTLGNIFKEDLAKIGIKMTVDPQEWSNQQKIVQDREFDAVTGAWGGSPEVDYNQLWHSEQAELPKSSNHCYFKNPEADRIIEEMKTAFAFEERKALSHEFHQLLYDEQPYTFFYTRKRPAFWQPHIKNVWFGMVRPYRNHRAWYQVPSN